MDRRRQSRTYQVRGQRLQPVLRARRSEDALKIRGSRKLIRAGQQDANNTACQQLYRPHAGTGKCRAPRVGTSASGTEGAARGRFARIKIRAALATAAVGFIAPVRHELGQAHELQQDHQR